MKRIFYAEDEPFLAKIVKETLEGQGYDVTLVDDGKNALRIYESNTFDICVLDIMLPNMSGFDIAKEIRNISNQIPIIFLTAKDSTEDVVKGFQTGGNDYLRKPFSIEELIVRIENLLTLYANESIKSGELCKISASFTFYPKRMELVSAESIKKLSHKEVTILSLLCKNINRVTSRKEILLHGWGDDSFFNSRNLDVYISRLRGYFKSDDNISIVTLKGIGYRFIVT